MKYVLLTILFSPVFSQYVADLGMKPDVTFGDHNDRFDLTSFVQEQKDSFIVNPSSNEDYRRHGNSAENTKYKVKTRKQGVINDFAYHDEMISGEGGSVADFEENLNKFRMPNRRVQSLVNHLHGIVGRRRRNNPGVAQDPEKEILLHYAVPIQMTINGYLQPPLVE